MTSHRKIAANRSNSRRSSGPRTAAGKLNASRNSRKHGLAANYRQPAAAADIEHLAKTICGDEQDTALLAQARVIAENELVLRAVRAQKLAVVERLGEPKTIALTPDFIKEDEAANEYCEQHNKRQKRDKYQALEEAAPDLQSG